MMFTNARNPKWTNADHTSIMVEVERNGEWMGFVAGPTDCTDYGPMLYNFAVNGIFGEIADSDEERIISGEIPVPEGYVVKDGKLVNTALYEQQAQAELDRRLGQLTNPEAQGRAALDEGYAAERKAAIEALLAVKEQPGWPLEVKWPE
jgi:hypothetical protein